MNKRIHIHISKFDSTSNNWLEESHIVAKKQKLQIQKVPNQPNKISFPLDEKNNRKFPPIWFKSFPWLEWDEILSAASCHPCWQIFLVDSVRCTNSKSEDTLFHHSKIGRKPWKN